MMKMPENTDLHETNKYDDQSFPYQMYRITKDGITPPGRGYMDLHWHEELQFTLVTKGMVTIQINGDAYTLIRGEAVFINRGLLHVTTNISADGEYVSFNFPDKLLSFFTGSRIEQTYVLPFTTNYTLPATIFRDAVLWQKEILDHLWKLEVLMQSPAVYGWEYMISLRINSMWYILIRNLSGSITQTSKAFIRKQQRIQTLINYIQEHYAKDLSLRDIASAAHISNGECCRCFKNLLHTTPIEYLCNYRIEQSIELLNNTDYSITDIAGMVGFHSASQYIRHFKNKYGKTPREYR